MTELKHEGYLKNGNFLGLGVWLCFGNVLVSCRHGEYLSPRGAPESFAPLAERLLPAVVNISTRQNLRRENRSGTLKSTARVTFRRIF